MPMRVVAPVIAAIAALVLLLLSQALETANSGIDATDAQTVAMGKELYQKNCATDCHGADLKGQPNWKVPLAEGGLPSPPHDASGHTWHHDDQLLFDYTKKGGAALAPTGFVSRMPGFGDTLSDEQIWAVLSYIKSTWPEEIQRRQEMRNKN